MMGTIIDGMREKAPSRRLSASSYRALRYSTQAISPRLSVNRSALEMPLLEPDFHELVLPFWQERLRERRRSIGGVPIPSPIQRYNGRIVSGDPEHHSLGAAHLRRLAQPRPLGLIPTTWRQPSPIRRGALQLQPLSVPDVRLRIEPARCRAATHLRSK